MLDVRLTKRQGDFAVDVALGAAGPTVTALFGRSGSGKTSVIEMVAGLRRPDSGRVAVDDHVLFDSEAGIALPPHRRAIGCVFQDARLFPHFTVRGNLTYGMRAKRQAGGSISFDHVVDILGLGALLDRRPAKLSGGEKQRVAIGRALLTSPRLLLMDEPLASLDGARKAELLSFIALLPGQFNLPILYVTHAVDEVLRLADRLVLMEGGKVVASGTVEDVMSRPEFAAVAGGRELATIVHASVVRHDEVHGTTHLAFAGGELRAPAIGAPVGSRMRVRIDAADVILAVEEPRGLSVQNVLPARIVKIAPAGGLVDVALDAGCPLQAQITLQACTSLRLTVGQPVFALVKSAAISRGDIAEHDC